MSKAKISVEDHLRVSGEVNLSCLTGMFVILTRSSEASVMMVKVQAYMQGSTGESRVCSQQKQLLIDRARFAFTLIFGICRSRTM